MKFECYSEEYFRYLDLKEDIETHLNRAKETLCNIEKRIQMNKKILGRYLK